MNQDIKIKGVQFDFEMLSTTSVNISRDLSRSNGHYGCEMEARNLYFKANRIT